MTEASIKARLPAADTLGERILRDWDAAIVPLVFVTMLVVFYSLDANFLSGTNIVNVLNQVSILAVVTSGREHRHLHGRLRPLGGRHRGALRRDRRAGGGPDRQRRAGRGGRHRQRRCWSG